MSIRLTSLVNFAITIDSVVLPPFASQTRAGSSITSQMAAAVVLRQAQADLLPAESSGGASLFTDLTDVEPDSLALYPGGLVVVNDAGTQLYCQSALTVTEDNKFNLNGGSGAGGSSITDNSTGGLTLTANGVGGLQVSASGAGGVLVTTGVGGFGVVSTSEIYLQAGGTQTAITLATSGSLGLFFTGLPTANPAVAGRVWNDAGTLKISAG